MSRKVSAVQNRVKVPKVAAPRTRVTGTARWLRDGGEHRPQQRRVGHGRPSRQGGDDPGHHDREDPGGDSGQHVDGAPAEQVGDDPADGAGQQDADQHAGGDGADHAAALGRVGQLAGQRDEQLGADGGQADQQQRGEQHHPVRCAARPRPGRGRRQRARAGMSRRRFSRSPSGTSRKIPTA